MGDWHICKKQGVHYCPDEVKVTQVWICYRTAQFVVHNLICHPLKV